MAEDSHLVLNITGQKIAYVGNLHKHVKKIHIYELFEIIAAFTCYSSRVIEAVNTTLILITWLCFQWNYKTKWSQNSWQTIIVEELKMPLGII